MYVNCASCGGFSKAVSIEAANTDFAIENQKTDTAEDAKLLDNWVNKVKPSGKYMQQQFDLKVFFARFVLFKVHILNECYSLPCVHCFMSDDNVLFFVSSGGV